MTNTHALLERARKLCDPPTWYRLAKDLEISHVTVSRCVKHNGTLDNHAAFRLADKLGMDRAQVIAYFEVDRAPEHRRAWWERQLPRLLSAVGLAVALLVGHGTERPQEVRLVEQSIHYAHRRWLISRIKTVWHGVRYALRYSVVPARKASHLRPPHRRELFAALRAAQAGAVRMRLTFR